METVSFKFKVVAISVSCTYTKVNIQGTFHVISKDALILFLNPTYLSFLQAMRKDWHTAPKIN